MSDPFTLREEEELDKIRAGSRQPKRSPETTMQHVATQLFSKEPEHVHGPWMPIEWEYMGMGVNEWKRCHGAWHQPKLKRVSKVACSSCLEPRAVAFDKRSVPTMRN